MEGRRAGGACFKMNNMNFRRAAQPKAGLAGCTTRQASELHMKAGQRAAKKPAGPAFRAAAGSALCLCVAFRN